jgi:hypothetical protein
MTKPELDNLVRIERLKTEPPTQIETAVARLDPPAKN